MGGLISTGRWRSTSLDCASGTVAVTVRKEGKSAAYLSIEHRWAVGNRNVQGENNRAIDWCEKRRLGNFALLELRFDIHASNASLEAKLARYKGQGHQNRE